MNPVIPMVDAPNAYLERHGFCGPQIAEPPADGLGVVVVIPCHDEPHLSGTLESLSCCTPPACAVEVIVVINAGEDAPEDVRRRNGETLREAEAWLAAHPRAGFRCHLLDFPALPERHAGVGLARKIGMDEAAMRLHAAGNPRGVIAGLDADCRVAPDYLLELERYFRRHPAVEAASLYFEHVPHEAGDAMLAEGIVHYELYLRYFVLALKCCGYPFAWHTLGSCMAVRADAYLRQGGMNRRKAAEDFYFLGKFMTLGGFGEIRSTTVYPAPRPSHRVPFGTGRAMRRWLERGGVPEPTFHPGMFMDLRKLLESLDALYALREDRWDTFLAGLPPAVGGFLAEAGLAGRWREIRANSASSAAFRKRFFRWFDRFRVLKYVHFAAGRHYPMLPLSEAVARLLAWQGLCDAEDAAEADARALLEHLRRMEREGVLLPFRREVRASSDSAHFETRASRAPQQRGALDS